MTTFALYNYGFEISLPDDHDGSKPITYLSKNGKQTYKHKWLMKPQHGIYYFRLLHELPYA